MRISDTIAHLIEEMLTEGGGSTELRRNDLAERLGCVPSQINYVITSRFTADKGYIIESRRGGGGYIRIIKKQMGGTEYLMHVFHSVGREIDAAAADAYIANLYGSGCLSLREARIIKAASAFAADNESRADMLRQIILTVMK